MDFLGYTYEKPSIGKDNKWNMVEIEYPDDTLFNETTGKIMKGFKDKRYRFIISDEDNNRYFVDILDVRYDVPNNIIKIWPYSCREIQK